MLDQNVLKSIFLVLLLAAASFLSVSLVVLRILTSGQAWYVFLVWNLFLAWMPLLFAWLAAGLWAKPAAALPLAGLWLIFLPNAPYIVTDFIHLRWASGVFLWYDVLMIGSFALTGLALGVIAMRLMQARVAASYGRAAGRLLVVTTAGLSGFGVYVGRFLRWNSWDIFTNPFGLLHDIIASFTVPHLMLRMVAVSVSLSAVFLFAYLATFTTRHLQPVKPNE